MSEPSDTAVTDANEGGATKATETSTPAAVSPEADAQDVAPASCEDARCGEGTEPDCVVEVSDTEPDDANTPPSCDRRSRALIKTTPLDPRDVRPSWPMAIASLEKLSGWAVLALRLGTLTLIQQCVRELSVPAARAEAVARLRALTEALAHMPLEA